ncbi:MAG TPA: DUF3127 domain-containing protein [Bacteroidales bacterium]|nr:DUF3127 domain-containing protein [Lentimicrobiaceae bacterium]HOH99208.1 DUF3127 domain-containing protein [Bacteroidales bacterium]
MSFEIQGKLVHKFAVNEVNPSFRKREFVIEHSEAANGREFTDYIRFQLTQDRCSLIDRINEGTNVLISFRIRGRKWEKDGEPVYFTNLEAFRVQPITTEDSRPAMAQAPDEPLEPLLPDGDDLPF